MPVRALIEGFEPLSSEQAPTLAQIHAHQRLLQLAPVHVVLHRAKGGNQLPVRIERDLKQHAPVIASKGHVRLVWLCMGPRRRRTRDGKWQKRGGCEEARRDVRPQRRECSRVRTEGGGLGWLRTWLCVHHPRHDFRGTALMCPTCLRPMVVGRSTPRLRRMVKL